MPDFDPHEFDSDPQLDPPHVWAARYRALGMQVVPSLTPFQKGPAIPWRPLQRALMSQEEFEALYHPQTGAHRLRDGMGVITGPCSGRLYLIDLDTQKPGSQAASWWRGVLAVHNNGMELETWEQVTGGGGRHLFFRYPEGWKALNSSSAKFCVDTRGLGGFAVLAPSQHKSGRTYAWAPGRAPWENELLAMPPWLIEEVDRLVREHGGVTHASAARPAGYEGEPEFNAFGRNTDRREQHMADHVWAALIGFRVEAPIPPGEREREATWAEFERNNGPKEPQPGESNADGLEREGRGLTEFNRKWAAALAKWDAEIASEAAVRMANAPRRASDPPDFEGEEPVSAAPEPDTPVKVRSAFPIDEAKIPPRNWVIPGLMLKRNVSVLVAPPGSGKSLLTLQLAIAVANGGTWGGWTPRAPEKVLVINSEDDFDEMQRRLVVAAREMGIAQQDLVGRIDLADTPENIVIARHDARLRAIVRTPLVEQLVETIRAKGYGLVVVDPFAETFEGDENANSEVKWAGVLWREVARRAGCTLLLVHHTKKYAGAMAGDADASRGGGALIGIARILSTLFDMTEDEASAMSIEPEKRFDYVRFDDAKANHAKKGAVRWFEKVTRQLSNATAFIPADDVGVLVPWTPKDALEGVSTQELGLLLDTIERGLLDDSGAATGQLWSDQVNAKGRWVGKLCVRMLECTDEAAKNLIREWIKNDVLKVVDYSDPVLRKPRTGLRVVAANRPDRTPVYG